MKLESNGIIIYIDDASTEAASINAGYDWTFDPVTSVVTILGTKSRTDTVSSAVTYTRPQYFSSQVTHAKGTTATAANDLVLTQDGNSFLVTGSTRINALTTTGWTAGSRVVLIFRDAPTVKHDTAGGASTAPFLLEGSVDLSASTNTVLEVIYDGSYWQELSRKRP